MAFVNPVLRKHLKVACVQISSGVDKFKNLAHAKERVLQAAAAGACLVVLPECFNSPYSTSQFSRYAEIFPVIPATGLDSDSVYSKSPSLQALSAMARDAKVYLIGGSIPERVSAASAATQDRIYSTCTVWSPSGDLLAAHRKLHLFDVEIPGGITFRESDTLSAGNRITIVDLPEYGKIAIGICYDMRFAEPAIVSAQKGVFALIYPSAFNTTTGPLHWELLGRSRALDNQVYSVLCSQSRSTDSDYPAWGHSLVADPMGQLVASADESESILYADLDMEMIEKTRVAIPTTSQKRHDVYPDIAKLACNSGRVSEMN